MKKLLFWILCFIFSTDAFSQNYSGISISGAYLGQPTSATNITAVTTIGDSITSGSSTIDAPFAYRFRLQQVIGIRNYILVGPINAPPVGSYPTYFSVAHCGVGGNKTSDVITRETACLTPLNSYTNKLAIVLIGINDVLTSVAVATVTSNLQTIINNIVSNDANTLIYVSLIMPSNTVNAAVITQNTDYLTMLHTMQGLNSNIHIVDGYTAMTDLRGGWAGNTIDGTHPNDVGFSAFANAVGNCINNSTSHYCDGN